MFVEGGLPGLLARPHAVAGDLAGGACAARELEVCGQAAPGVLVGSVISDERADDRCTGGGLVAGEGCAVDEAADSGISAVRAAVSAVERSVADIAVG